MKMKELVLCYGTLLEKFVGRGLIQMALPEPVRPTCEPEDVPLFPVPGTYFHFCFLVLKVLNSDF